jgi:hypothetical protein
VPAPVREVVERRSGIRLAQVEMYRADAAAAELGARAFTVGRRIYFGAGEGPANVGLLAHEATHVRQQTARSREAVQCQAGGGGGSPDEAEADASARAADADMDETLNRAPGWIYAGGHGSWATIRRMLRCGDMGMGCTEGDLTLFNHPWFQHWYLEGARWLRTLPAAERAAALAFLVDLNTYRGRQQLQDFGQAWMAHLASIEGLRAPPTARGGEGPRPPRAAPEPAAGPQPQPPAAARPVAPAEPPPAPAALRRAQLRLIRGGASRSRPPGPAPHPEAPVRPVPVEEPLPAAVGSGLSGGAPGGGATIRPAASRTLNPRQRGAYWSAGARGAETRPFPTGRNAMSGRRTRGAGRGGVTRWDRVAPEELDALRQRWFQEMRARGTPRREVEGRMLAAGINPETPRWRRVLDELWGPRQP